MSARISSRLPAGEACGLDAIATDLVRDPHKIRVVVALLDCVKVVTETDTGDTVPVARIRRVEAITDPKDGERLIRLLTRAYEQRTGQSVLPLDLEEDIEAALGLVNIDDPDGGR